MIASVEMAIIIVARVSSREQSEGYSIDQQLRECLNHAAKKNMNVVKEFRLIESAKDSSSRTKFNNEILGFIREHQEVKGVLCHKVDRFARNMQDAETLDAMGVKQIFVQMDFPQNALGTFMRRIATAQAAFYVDNLREEVIKGFNGCVEAGFLPHHPPYPYKTDRNLKRHIPDPDKIQKYLALHREWVGKRHTLDSIRQWLLDNNIWFSNSKKYWTRSNIDNILKNPFPSGWFMWHGKLYKGSQEPIITWQDHQAALARFSEANRGNMAKHGHTYAKGLFYCECGAAITAELQKGIVYYRCANPKCRFKDIYQGERRRYTPESILEQNIARQIIQPLEVPKEIAEWSVETLKTMSVNTSAETKAKISSLESQLSKINDRLNVLLDSHLDGLIDIATYKLKQNEMTGQKADLEGQIADLKTKQPASPENGIKFIELSQHLVKTWLEKEKLVRRKMLDSILLNCIWDGKIMKPEYRKPFDVLAVARNLPGKKETADSEESAVLSLWSGRVDLNHRLPAPKL